MQFRKAFQRSTIGIIVIFALALILVSIQPAFAQKVSLKIACTPSKTHPIGKGLLLFKKNVEELSKGEIKVKVFLSGALGGAVDNIQGVQAGSIEMASDNAGSFIPFCPEFDIWSLPFLWKSPEQIHEFVDGPFGDALTAALEKRLGITSFGYSTSASRQIEAKVPIYKVEDMKGLKIRVMNDPGLINAFKHMGAIPTPISFKEVYSAAQSGVVDGLETSFVAWISNKLYEVAKYGIRVNYSDTGRVYYANKKWFDSLEPAQQKIIRDAMRKTIQFVRDEYAIQGASVEKRAKELGAVIIDPDLESFKKAVMPIYDKFNATMGNEWIKKIRDE